MVLAVRSGGQTYTLNPNTTYSITKTGQVVETSPTAPPDTSGQPGSAPQTVTIPPSTVTMPPPVPTPTPAPQPAPSGLFSPLVKEVIIILIIILMAAIMAYVYIAG